MTRSEIGNHQTATVPTVPSSPGQMIMFYCHPQLDTIFGKQLDPILIIVGYPI